MTEALTALRRTIDDLAGKQVLVWGVGSHGGGLAAARFCAEKGATVALLDLLEPERLPDAAGIAQEEGWPWFVGNHHHPAITQADLVICSPALPPSVVQAVDRDVVVAEALFFAVHHGPRVAVTGTKGKSTIARLCGRALGWAVAGNSHEPLLDLLARCDDRVPVVCELSSFMLWHLRRFAPAFSLGISGLIAADHLDWHPGHDHYLEAKALLPGWCTHHIAWDQTGTDGVQMRNGAFIGPTGETIATRDEFPLPGNHNERNACLALTAATMLGAGYQALRETLTAAQALPHRLETVHRSGALRFIDDSAATNPVAAMAAVRAIEGPLVVIAGGSSKGVGFDDLVAVWRARCDALLLIGQAAVELQASCRRAGFEAIIAESLLDAMRQALPLLGDPGAGTILLSPGCASFGQFRDYADRGEQFARFARALCPS